MNFWKVSVSVTVICHILLASQAHPVYKVPDEEPSIPVPHTDSELSDLFFDIKERDTPLYFCDGNSDGIKYKIPENLECDNVPDIEAKNHSKVLEVTLWWIDISVKEIKAHECWGEMYTETRIKGFWGGTEEKTSKKTNVFVSESQCRDMKNSGKTPDGRNMERIAHGTQGTKMHDVPEYSWCSTVSITNTNYYISSVTISVNKEDNSINTLAAVTENCVATAGQCPTYRGVVIWSPSDVPACRVKEGMTIPCILTGSRLSCQEVQMSFPNVTTTELCGKIVGTNGQSVFFTSREYNEMSKGITSTSEVRADFKAPFAHGSSRGKRSVNLVSQDEFESRMQYMYEIIRDGHNFDVTNLHKMICQNSQRILDMARFQAESGNPTALARTLTGDPSYRAKLSGDVIRLYKCHEITKYYFLPPSSSNCSEEAKIKFLYGNEIKDGYVSGLSHQIVTEATDTPCPSNFYFQMEKDLVLIGDRSKAAGLPVLPYAGTIPQPKLLPPLTFYSPGVYGSHDLGHDTIRSLMKEIQRQRATEGAITNFINGKPLNERQKPFKDAVQAWSWESYSGYIKWIIVAVGVIAAMVACVLIKIYLEPITKAISLFLNVFKRCCPKTSENPPLTTANVVVRKNVAPTKSYNLAGVHGQHQVPKPMFPPVPPRQAANVVYQRIPTATGEEQVIFNATAPFSE